LKTFLTQFGPALPLTPDPPVRLRDDKKGGTIIKTAIWGTFLPKKHNVFVTQHHLTHPVYPRRAHPTLAVSTRTIRMQFSFKAKSAAYEPVQLAPARRGVLGGARQQAYKGAYSSLHARMPAPHVSGRDAA
jgi:hypothetical protein